MCLWQHNLCVKPSSCESRLESRDRSAGLSSCSGILAARHAEGMLLGSEAALEAAVQIALDVAPEDLPASLALAVQHLARAPMESGVIGESETQSRLTGETGSYS